MSISISAFFYKSRLNKLPVLRSVSSKVLRVKLLPEFVRLVVSRKCYRSLSRWSVLVSYRCSVLRHFQWSAAFKSRALMTSMATVAPAKKQVTPFSPKLTEKFATLNKLFICRKWKQSAVPCLISKFRRPCRLVSENWWKLNAIISAGYWNTQIRVITVPSWLR